MSSHPGGKRSLFSFPPRIPSKQTAPQLTGIWAQRAAQGGTRGVPAHSVSALFPEVPLASGDPLHLPI